MRNKSVLTSPRIVELKRQKNKILKRRILLFFLLFLTILFGLSFLSRWGKLNINNIEITGNKIIETKLIEETVREQIAGNYFYFFPKTNFIIYPQNKIELALKDKFKRIKDVFVNDKNINTLEISISERSALYTWCGIEPIKNNDNNQKCYFLDESGYIFDEAPYFSEDVYFRFYGSVGRPTSEISSVGYYFFEQDFNRLVSFKETLKKIELKPTALYVMNNGDVKILLSSQSTTGENPEIIFKLNSDFEKIVENLQSVLTTEPLQSDFKNKYSDLLYIDLRFGNKVYYKFK
ncbi:MAG: hypothetical protein WC822_05070 [Candidatus Paceibacterota bacterium]|jgi:hypothetical protein